MIIIGGATATGKSDLAIKLAKEINGEIISADSIQIYKYMDIGTAKLNKQEMNGIQHYMIDIVEPFQEYSVAEYQCNALNIICDIEKRGKIPIIVGGTGLYINSLIYPLNFANINKDNELRKSLENEFSLYGKDFLYQKLCDIDNNAAKTIHKNNTKRIIRAIEIKIKTGKSINDSFDKKEKRCFYQMYAIDFDRKELYQRINDRVELKMKNGHIDKVNDLLKNHNTNFDCQSMQAIGYKEFKDYFLGNIGKEKLVELIKQHSRNYAKRQYTWFKAYDDCKWINSDIPIKNKAKIVEDYYKNKEKIEQLL